MLQPLLDDPRVVRGGASVRQLSVDLIAVGDADLYVRHADAASVIDEYSLIPSQQPNVVLRVIPAHQGFVPQPIATTARCRRVTC
jgi:hypothetical protein